MGHFTRSDHAQALLEVAIFTPFLMVLLVSIIDIGRLEHFNMIVGSSARAGVQYGSQNGNTVVDPPGMSAAGQNDAQNLAGLLVIGSRVCKCSDGSSATCSSTCPTNTHLLTYASVTSTYLFRTLFNYHVIPASITLSRTEIMQVPQ